MNLQTLNFFQSNTETVRDKMEASVKAVMAEATEVDAELNGSSNICGMVVVDNRGLCIATEVYCRY